MHKKVTVQQLNASNRTVIVRAVKNTLDNETRYRLLKFLMQHPDWSQRQIARGMGISLGKVNYCLRALTERGFVKVGRFTRSQNKSDYRYLLTPKGVAEKIQTTARFLTHKQEEFEVIKQEIALLQRELKEHIAMEST
ncbi:uncharacterized protein METZ01_LOCUS314777 [marine metagenome]|uniref:HTH marR-type domain-containing protein n=1 Tax=marine metagenome TaxID=408172 RepID=A0A382NL39_9ZZZZ